MKKKWNKKEKMQENILLMRAKVIYKFDTEMGSWGVFFLVSKVKCSGRCMMTVEQSSGTVKTDGRQFVTRSSSK